MSERRTFICRDDAVTARMVADVHRMRQAGMVPQVVLSEHKAKRSNDQNAGMWADLTDVSRQVEWHGMKLSPEDWKHIFSASLKRQRAVPGLDGGFVVLGIHTSKMSVGEMCELRELIWAFGAQQGVKFTAPERAAA